MNKTLEEDVEYYHKVMITGDVSDGTFKKVGISNSFSLLLLTKQYEKIVEEINVEKTITALVISLCGQMCLGGALQWFMRENVFDAVVIFKSLVLTHNVAFLAEFVEKYGSVIGQQIIAEGIFHAYIEMRWATVNILLRFLENVNLVIERHEKDALNRFGPLNEREVLRMKNWSEIVLQDLQFRKKNLHLMELQKTNFFP